MTSRVIAENRRILRRRVARLAILNRNPADSERLCKPAFTTPPPEAYDRRGPAGACHAVLYREQTFNGTAPSFVLMRTQCCNFTPKGVRVKASRG
jgi:hypothetical protein